jgi:hypothetical protein
MPFGTEIFVMFHISLSLLDKSRRLKHRGHRIVKLNIKMILRRTSYEDLEWT